MTIGNAPRLAMAVVCVLGAAARHAFTTNTDHCDFHNKEGLPAVPFRTDPDWSAQGR